MTIEKIEDIIAWQKAQSLSFNIYETFGLIKDYGFRDQIQRAGVSIMNNIAEGFERKGNKEFKHYLFIAKGSCGEVRSMLYLAQRLGYIKKEKFKGLYEQSVEVSKMLSGFIKTL